MRLCLRWLAAFHATFLGERPRGLWKVGTYWHLATRPDELEAMDDGALQWAAPLIDRRLSEARFRTLVHGDAKPANFCFSTGNDAVAGVDFQYVGGGCGMKDVAYLLGHEESERRVKGLLDHYFVTLRKELGRRGTDVDPKAVEAEWRSLYPFAWADHHRFLSGWAPSWSAPVRGRALTRQVIRSLE
jgi:aminoglycoside phosphotransferase (APT) family kinase protein